MSTITRPITVDEYDRMIDDGTIGENEQVELWDGVVVAKSLADDRGKKLVGYARAGIPVYWIVNLRDHQVEIYSEPDPTTGQYTHHLDYRPGDLLPVVIDGQTVGHLAVTDLLP